MFLNSAGRYESEKWCMPWYRWHMGANNIKILGYCILFSSTNRRNQKSQWGFESKYCLIYNICLERGADLHMAQLMPLSLTLSCSSKIQIGSTSLVPAHPGSPGQRAVKRVCVCVCVCVPTWEAGKEAHSLRQYILYVYVLFRYFIWVLRKFQFQQPKRVDKSIINHFQNV